MSRNRHAVPSMEVFEQQFTLKYYLCQGHFVLFDPTYRNIIGGYSPVVMYL